MFDIKSKEAFYKKTRKNTHRLTKGGTKKLERKKLKSQKQVLTVNPTIYREIKQNRVLSGSPWSQ